MGWDGMGWDGMGWDGMGWDGMGWDGMGWDGMGWDGLQHTNKSAIVECYNLLPGLLQLSTDGTLVKPFQSSERGQREVDFYAQVFDPQCTDPTLLGLQPLLPRFLGTWTTPQQPGGKCAS